MVTPFQNTDASIDQADINAKLGRPIGNDFCRAVQRNGMIVRLTALLLFVCRPSDIPFFVMPVYINSIKRVFSGWFFAQFIEKVIKRVKTKLNSAPAIVRIANYLRILTPFLGFNIANIFGRFTSAVSPRRIKLVAVATARFSAIRFQMTTCRRIGIAARTSAQPMNMGSFTLGRKRSPKQSNYRQTVECLSEQVNKVRMVRIDGFERVLGV